LKFGKLGYAIFSGLILGVLGGLVIFIWSLINNSFLVAPSIDSAIQASLIFGILGFILGLIIG
jgi:hypothetical protein